MHDEKRGQEETQKRTASLSSPPRRHFAHGTDSGAWPLLLSQLASGPSLWSLQHRPYPLMRGPPPSCVCTSRGSHRGVRDVRRAPVTPTPLDPTIDYPRSRWTPAPPYTAPLPAPAACPWCAAQRREALGVPAIASPPSSSPLIPSVMHMSSRAGATMGTRPNRNL
ncbi:hypothetical protein FB451DRAFT_1303059 [Mycena latifolia]|nr:hypothetical protein FB451DRAFT_1303059 [Mycena latifolia]